MRLSIRARTILALNAFVIAMALVTVWIAQDAAGRVVEERYVTETVTGVSRFLADTTFPMSDTMMHYLREMLNADWVALDPDTGRVAGSSLAVPLTREFAQLVEHSSPGEIVRLGGTRYRIESHDATESERATESIGVARSQRLYVLIPTANFQAVRSRASRRVVAMMAPAAVGATLLAVLLAVNITRPIQKLSREMDRIAKAEEQRAANVAPADDATHDDRAAADSRRTLLERGPEETRQLAASFYGLMDRLAAAHDRLGRNERLATLGKLCLSVAHELRNPLSGIKMNVRVLQDRMGPEDDPGVEAIVREIDRMGLYVDELMTLAPANGCAERSPILAPVQLSTLADSVLTILAARCRHARVAVQRDYPADEPAARADAHLVRQAMLNFIVNAIEAMPAGGTLTVAVQPRGAAVRFRVSDTGKGVAANGEDIFDAFWTTKPDGVGLGLYISRQIVQQHGGRIGHENGPAGATFWFELSTAPALRTNETQPTPVSVHA